MPFNTSYPPILELVSPPRLTKYRTTFKPQTDAQLYGAYIWTQHVGGALYPLLQSLEVTLRNTIDNAARTKFGDYWWNQVSCNRANISNTKFHKGIRDAEDKLNKGYPDYLVGMRDRKVAGKLNPQRINWLTSGSVHSFAR